MKAVWFCLGITLLWCLPAQAQVNWREVWGVTGEVQSITEEYSRIPPTGRQTAALLPSYRLKITFDRQGNILNRTMQDSPWVKTCEKFQPDTFGRPATTEEFAEYYVLKLLLVGHYWLAVPQLKERKLVNRVVIKYDEQNRILEQSRFNPDGTLSVQFRYRYDKFLQVIDTYEGGTKLIRRETKQFDEQGRLLESAGLNEKDEVTLKMVYEYGAQGPRQRLTIYNGAGLVTNQLTYDDHGEPLEHIQFDQQGNQTSVTTGRFEYDAQGNWRQALWSTEVRIPGKQGLQRAVTNRQIEYFPTQGNRQ